MGISLILESNFSSRTQQKKKSLFGFWCFKIAQWVVCMSLLHDSAFDNYLKWDMLQHSWSCMIIFLVDDIIVQLTVYN